MSLKSFLSSLVPNFERNRIIEDIDSLATDIESNLAPSYDAATKQLRGRKLASNAAKTMEAMFHLRFPQERQTTHVAFITAALLNSLDVLKVIERLVPELFNRDVTKDSLTYKKAAVLQYLSVVRYFADFSGRHLLRIIAAEDAALKGQAEDAELLPVDKKFFAENLETFLQVLAVVSIPPQAIAERLGQMQDLSIVVDKINTISATLGVENVDPLKLGFIGVNATSSPIYKIRSAYGNYQVACHNRNKELTKAIQLRLYALKDAQAGKNDPKLQQQIEYNTGRLARLNEEIAGFQERYG
ncbi:virion structural protein [Xanthomonas phage RTH11]|nr:virion structural protein [Xanthomonas phage RTH11]